MSEPETLLSVTVLPGTLLSTRVPAAWNSEIGSGPQPGPVHTPPETVFPVTCAVALRRTQIGFGELGYCTAPGVTTLFANVTFVVVAPNGGGGARPSTAAGGGAPAAAPPARP